MNATKYIQRYIYIYIYIYIFRDSHDPASGFGLFKIVVGMMFLKFFKKIILNYFNILI